MIFTLERYGLSSLCVCYGLSSINFGEFNKANFDHTPSPNSYLVKDYRIIRGAATPSS